MILEIDAGNTFTKWRLVDNAFCVKDSGKFLTDPASWDEEFTFISSPEKIWIGSVAGEEINRQFASFCHERWNIAPNFAESSRRFLNVTNGYFNPEQLGVDRWLAIIGGYQQLKSACCVIDCGTAVTMDFVNISGVHLGGYIVPGIYLLQTSLLENTREIYLQKDQSELEKMLDLSELGVNTHQAVKLGTLKMLVNFIQSVLDEQSQRHHQPFQCLLTGGDSPLLKQHLAINAIWEPNLIFSGLEWLMRSR